MLPLNDCKLSPTTYWTRKRYRYGSQELQRKLGFWAVLAIAVGTPSAPVFLYLWVKWQKQRARLAYGARVCHWRVNCDPANVRYAELSTAYPENGADYVYLKKPEADRWLSSPAGPASGPTMPVIVDYGAGDCQQSWLFNAYDPLLGKFIAAGLIIAFMLLHCAPLKAAQRFRR